MMKISVVIPVYNGGKYIEQAIKSVLRQPYKDIEIICVDDGSTDKSAEIVSEMAKKYENIRLIKKKNGGEGSARNTGLDAATGEYVAFLDVDDVWIDNSVTEDVINRIVQEQCNIVSFAYYFANESLTRVRDKPRKNEVRQFDLNETVSYSFASFFFRTVFLKSKELFFDIYSRNADSRFVLKCWFANTESILSFEKPLFLYRENRQSVTHKETNVIDELATLIRGYKELGDSTDNIAIREHCYYYVTRTFVELLEYLSAEKSSREIAHSYCKEFNIEELVKQGFASEYTLSCLRDAKHDWNRFVNRNSIRIKLRQIKHKLGYVTVLRQLYNLKVYPIAYNRQ